MNTQTLIVAIILLASLGSATAHDPAPSTAREAKPLAQLLEELGSDDWQVQCNAATELGERGPENLASIIPLLKSENPNARRGGCDAIMNIVRGIPGRKKADAEKKLAIVRPVIGPMLEIIENDPDDWTRTGAAAAVATFSSQAIDVACCRLVEVVVEILLDNDEDVWLRRSVYKIFNARDLPQDDLDQQTVITIHLNASRFMDIMFRGGSMQALARMGADAAPAVPTMIDYAEDFYRTGKDNRKGIYAIRALGAIGAPAKDGLPILRKLAADGQQGVAPKYGTDRMIENAKKEAATAIEQIEAALKESDKPKE